MQAVCDSRRDARTGLAHSCVGVQALLATQAGGGAVVTVRTLQAADFAGHALADFVQREALLFVCVFARVEIVLDERITQIKGEERESQGVFPEPRACLLSPRHYPPPLPPQHTPHMLTSAQTLQAVALSHTRQLLEHLVQTLVAGFGK